MFGFLLTISPVQTSRLPRDLAGEIVGSDAHLRVLFRQRVARRPVQVNGEDRGAVRLHSLREQRDQKTRENVAAPALARSRRSR